MPTRVSSPRFVGRAAELATLEAALARAAAGQSAAVLVAGDAGMGKSRLVAVFEERAREAGAEVLVGECVELAEGELPYGPIVAALRLLVGQSGGAIETLHASARVALARLWPELADPATGASSGEFAQGQLFEAVHRLIAAHAAEQPIVLVVEDLHWADRSTRDLLAFLIRNSRREAVLFVASYRTDEVNRRHPLHPFVSELDRSGRAERVTLPPFDEAELREQLSGILGEEPDARLVRRLFERSEGNPFFAEELLAAADAGMLPESLLDALLARVERLSEPARRTLQVAAAVGRPVSHALFASASDLSESELRDALREAASERILMPTEDGMAYAFRHELLREAVYADLLPGERAALHVSLAEALASDRELAEGGQAAAELAHHWHAAGRAGPALSASLDAAAQAESVHAYAEALRQLERALELIDRVPAADVAGADSSGIMRRAAEAALLSGDHRRGIALARTLVAERDAAVDPTAAGLAHARLARHLWLDGQGDEALEHYETALELVPAEPSTERAQVLGASAHSLMLHGRFADARERGEEALEIARKAGARRVEVNVLITLSVASNDNFEPRLASLRAARAMAEELGAIEEVGRSWVNEAHLLEQAGRMRECVAVTKAGIARAEELGTARMWGDYLAGDLAGRLAALGEYGAAEACAREILELTSTALDAASAHTALGQVAVERGNLELAVEHVERSVELSRTAGAMWSAPNCAVLMAAALWRGDPDEALEAMRRILDAVALTDEFQFVAQLYSLGVRAEADRAERARALGREQDAEAARASASKLLEQLGAGRGLVEGGEVEREHQVAKAEFSRLEDRRDPQPWLDLAAMWEEEPRPQRAAYAEWRAAEAIVRAGGPAAEAEKLVRHALETAERLGANGLRDELAGLARRARLDVGGSAPAAPSSAAGDDLGLTDRERDVLVLLAEGRTNRQIGEQLFISEKTASVHVSRILAKLGVANRAEAAGIAHTLGLEPVGDADSDAPASV